jgi:hypothetical protein
VLLSPEPIRKKSKTYSPSIPEPAVQSLDEQVESEPESLDEQEESVQESLDEQEESLDEESVDEKSVQEESVQEESLNEESMEESQLDINTHPNMPPTTSPFQPEIIHESISGQNQVELKKYLKLYADLVKTKEENFKLKSKVIMLKEDLKQLQSKKTSRKAKLQGEELKNAFIDIILNSSLNIDSIPDDVEREIYSFIINQVTNTANVVSGIRKFFVCS